ncbi:30S ribosomal protein S27ae [Candidatus Woesearchaeota archaeon]|jgi:ribosomal protein S27AE|nr:30S ribosomal protein S27ae [Candidatus Woesearchaeota archaeon]|tara:strand:- start:258 stop:440 length:183 start_codon:yes stop_codon:yes gene_type:complete
MVDNKKPEKKKKTRQLWKLYEVQGDKLVRKNRFSPKSDGDFLADHSDRKTCGKTGYMEKK